MMKLIDFLNLTAKLDFAASASIAQCTAHEPFLNFL
jgi:hypothetical protein